MTTHHDPFQDGCPKCGGPVFWNTVGYDQFGSIQELSCLECEWCEEEDEL